MRSERLVRACARVAGLAPGGFVLGYVSGRAAARALSGCAFVGPCADITPVLVSLASAVLGMGAGNTLAALGVRYWWEGVVVWAVGILMSLVMMAIVGSVGALSAVGLFVAGMWLVVAAVLTLTGVGRSRSVENRTL